MPDNSKLFSNKHNTLSSRVTENTGISKLGRVFKDNFFLNPKSN